MYGGGGLTGAIYAHDFVEVSNAGSDPVSLFGFAEAQGRQRRALHEGLDDPTDVFGRHPVVKAFRE